MFFGALIDTQDAAGQIDFAMKEAEARYGELIWVLCLGGIPLRRIPGDLYPVQTDFLAN